MTRTRELQAQAFQQLNAATTGQHHVQDDGVVFMAQRCFQSAAVISGGHLNAFVAQVALQQADQSLVVIYDKYAAHAVDRLRRKHKAAVNNCYELPESVHKSLPCAEGLPAGCILNTFLPCRISRRRRV